jgi:hypothetical protein
MAETTKRGGLAPVPSGLFRPTAAAPGDTPADDQPAEAEGQGDEPGVVEVPSRPKARGKKPAASAKTRARNIRLSDDVHDRLWQLAHARRQTVSAVADELLNKALPRYEVKRLA